ncbi:MAG: hypothetical protein LBE13_08690 [Bacteroidales bacterium]|jgi:hypothetical protein|nr:hypothetical protein [Bacteroidales bacterium]
MKNENCKKSKGEIISLNEQLFANYSIEELEQRLETDPMFLSNLFGGAPVSQSEGCCLFACNDNYCGEQL